MTAVVWKGGGKNASAAKQRERRSDSRRVRRKRVSATAAPLWYPTLESL
jgi:hypothetical protein